MTVVNISDEQAKLIGEATSLVVLVDSAGRQVATVSPSRILPADAAEEDVIAEIERRIATHDGNFRPFSDLLKELHERFSE